MDCTYTNEEIDEFERMKYPWMDNIHISPRCISFSENMYGDEYCILKSTDIKGVTCFVRQIMDKDTGVFVNNEATEGSPGIKEACRAIELDLFMNSIFDFPNLSEIPIDYLFSLTDKYRIRDSSFPFLIRLILMKYAQMR